jgi:hypothetical protein
LLRIANAQPCRGSVIGRHAIRGPLSSGANLVPNDRAGRWDNRVTMPVWVLYTWGSLLR